MHRCLFILFVCLCCAGLTTDGTLWGQDDPSPPKPENPRPAPPKPAPADELVDLTDLRVPTWDLEELDAKYRPGFAALQDMKYDEAKKIFQEELRQAKKTGSSKETKKLKFLTNVAKELMGAQKLAHARPSYGNLQKSIALTSKNRETFAYFHFLDMEREIREQCTLTISDFEPPVSFFDSGLLKPFEPFRPRLTQAFLPNLTSDPGTVVQGRFAFHWQDTPENRYMGSYLSSPTPDWSPYKYLCFSAKLTDPKSATLRITIAADANQQNRWIIGAGTWKGWKKFRINFRKEASMEKSNTHKKMSWREVSHLVIWTKGGLTDFYLDNVYLCK